MSHTRILWMGQMFIHTLLRPYMEYCIQVWNPVYAGDIKKMEKIQNRFSRLLRLSSVTPPSQRNELLGITCHEKRRLRGDLIYIFKMFDSGIFTPSMETRTRGHSRKLIFEFSRTNYRKHSFALRNIDSWNILPESVVSAPSLNSFKARLDDILEK